MGAGELKCLVQSRASICKSSGAGLGRKCSGKRNCSAEKDEMR
jgi:hypothetical protein